MPHRATAVMRVSVLIRQRQGAEVRGKTAEAVGKFHAQDKSRPPMRRCDGIDHVLVL